MGGRLTLAAGLAPTMDDVKGAAMRVRLPLNDVEIAGGTVAIPCRALTVASDDRTYARPS